VLFSCALSQGPGEHAWFRRSFYVGGSSVKGSANASGDVGRDPLLPCPCLPGRPLSLVKAPERGKSQRRSTTILGGAMGWEWSKRIGRRGIKGYVGLCNFGLKASRPPLNVSRCSRPSAGH